MLNALQLINMTSDDLSSSPPQFGRIARLKGFLPLNNDDASPLSTHGTGTLNSLIKSRSHTSLQNIHRRPSSLRGPRDGADEEEAIIGSLGAGRRNSRELADGEDFRRSITSEERRLSVILNGPQMRSQRLIGNSNPRYRWEQYWKTEEELKTMKKPMFVLQLLCYFGTTTNCK